MVRRLVDFALFIVLIQIWQFGFLGYLFIREGYDAVTRYLSKGEITPLGLKLDTTSKAIPFKEITEISGGYERSPVLSDTIIVEVSLGEDHVDVCLNDNNLAMLAKTQLNKWTISTTYNVDKKLIQINQGLSGETLSISYDKVGKYALPPYLVSLTGFPIFGLSILGLFLEFYDAIGLFVIMTTFAGVCFIPSFYQEVLVKLDKEGVSLKDDFSEQFLPYTEVAKVEKLLFCIVVTSINGEVFYFPKACYLLPELINEFTKEAHVISNCCTQDG